MHPAHVDAEKVFQFRFFDRALYLLLEEFFCNLVDTVALEPKLVVERYAEH